MEKTTVVLWGRFEKHIETPVDHIEVQGYKFTVHDLPFVVHKALPTQCKGEGWTVTEPTSGTALIDYAKPTRDSAIKYATHKLEKAGPVKTREAIKRMVTRRLTIEKVGA